MGLALSERSESKGQRGPLMKFLKTRLAIMMFIQYVIWGAWYVTITTYLTQTLNFTGTQAGLVFSTVSLASLVSPFFVGLSPTGSLPPNG